MTAELDEAAKCRPADGDAREATVFFLQRAQPVRGDFGFGHLDTEDLEGAKRGEGVGGARLFDVPLGRSIEAVAAAGIMPAKDVASCCGTIDPEIGHAVHRAVSALGGSVRLVVRIARRHRVQDM